MPSTSPYIGRFAPSPTGALHAGSVVAALASWLDARAHRGIWLVRMEDVDEPRCSQAHGEEILRQLAALGMNSDHPVIWQSQRTQAYAAAVARLRSNGNAYDCGCTRKDIETALARLEPVRQRHAERVYPGTCRTGLHGKPARAIRFRCPDTPSASDVHWVDRRLGSQMQNVARETGDFIVQRADGYFSYQLAVVVDDAAQGITHIVRGEDLCDNTARQILAQRAFGFATPHYLHTPLVLAADGQKLSKQNGAFAADTDNPLKTLQEAARVLGLPCCEVRPGETLSPWLSRATAQWHALYNGTP
jgi:glutamyl-Q tRNA(Asp) synthetase